MGRSAWNIWCVTLIICAFNLVVPQTLSAQTSELCFTETTQCISGPIKTYWQANGGLSVFGYPITSQRIENVEGHSLTVQWFERDRLEIQMDGHVTAGRLGARWLELNNQSWQFGDATIPHTEYTSHGNDQCRMFNETGYAVCGKFRKYWEQHGGLARFGYPIGNEHITQIDGRWLWVQYFERRRMEYHPSLAGTPYEILLGLLGSAVYNAQSSCIQTLPAAFQKAYQKLTWHTAIGCPTLMIATDVAASLQQFEHGEMLWFDDAPYLRWSIGPRIFAITRTPHRLFRVFQDNWSAEQTQPTFTPPPQRYAPWRGFGVVWQQHPTLATQFGWATDPVAIPLRINYQLFEGGVLLVHIPERNVIYAFDNPENSDVVEIIPIPE